MNIWKRNAIVAVVVLFVCVAVYMNWSMNQVTPVDSEYESFEASMSEGQAAQASTTEVPSAAPSGNLVGSDAAPGSSADPAASPAASAAPTGESQESSYFSEARLSRQQARDSALSVLNDAAGQESASSEGYAEEVSAIAQSALREVRIESLVKAKGYADCVAFISDDGISVVVAAPSSGLNQTDVAKIRDIAQSETGFPTEQIKIVEVK